MIFLPYLLPSPRAHLTILETIEGLKCHANRLQYFIHSYKRASFTRVV